MTFQDIIDKAIKITDVQELGDVMISQLSGLFEIIIEICIKALISFLFLPPDN